MGRFTIYQGETKTIEVEVLTRLGTPALLVGATVKAYLYKKHTAVVLPYTIAENIVTVTFDPSQTILMYGAYDYEISIVDSLQAIDLKVQDTFFVRASYMTLES